MGNIDVERNLDYFFKLTNLTFQGPTNLMSVVQEILKYLDKDPTAKLLNNYIKQGGQLDFTMCRPEHAKELSEMLKDNGIVFLETQSLANGGVYMFVYADVDRERVQEVLNDFRAIHQKNGIADKSTFWAYAEGDVRRLKDLDLSEAMIISEHAEARGIKIDIVEPSKGHFDITYAAKDKEIMNRIKLDTAIELSGLAGKALKKQLEYENENYKRIIRMACTYNKDKPMHVVDLQNQHMEIDNYGVKFLGKDGIITVERNEEEYNERVNQLIQKMRGPVSLRDDQYKKYENEIDKKKFLVNADKENGRPSYTEEEYKAVNEIIQKKDLYEMKLAMLDPDERVYDICIENEDMRLATFEEYNDINEEDIEEYKDSQELDPDLLKEMNNKYRSFQDEVVTEHMIDREFEESILDGVSRDDSLIEDLAFDVMHDKNANYIPDEYEVEE